MPGHGASTKESCRHEMNEANPEERLCVLQVAELKRQPTYKPQILDIEFRALVSALMDFGFALI